MGTPKHFVRVAELSDAQTLAQVQQAGWAQRYALVLPPDALPPTQQLAQVWSETLSAPVSDPTSGLLLVAIDAGAVVGMLSAAPCTDDDARDGEVEIAELVVHPDYGGQGHGSRLLAAWADLSRAAGVTSAVMWVASGDDELRGLLTEAGFAADGARGTWDLRGDGTAQVRMLRMTTELDEQASPQP